MNTPNESVILTARQAAQEAFDPRVLSSKIWQVCDDHFVKIVTWLWEKVPYLEIVERCESELKLPPEKVPGKNSLSEFWRSSNPESRPFYQLVRHLRNKAWNATAEEIVKDAEVSAPNFAKANKELIRETAFGLLEAGAPPEVVKPFMDAELKLRDQELKERKLNQDDRKLAHDERKLVILEREKASALEALNNQSLSPEERERKIRETFGMA